MLNQNYSKPSSSWEQSRWYHLTCTFWNHARILNWKHVIWWRKACVDWSYSILSSSILLEHGLLVVRIEHVLIVEATILCVTKISIISSTSHRLNSSLILASRKHLSTLQLCLSFFEHSLYFHLCDLSLHLLVFLCDFIYLPLLRWLTAWGQCILDWLL